jgi:hypothetical protein
MNCISFSLINVPDDVFLYLLTFITGDEIKTMCDALPTFLQRMKNIKEWKEDYAFEIKTDITEETASFFLLHEIHWKQTVYYEEKDFHNDDYENDNESQLNWIETGKKTLRDGVMHSFKDEPACENIRIYLKFTTQSSSKEWYENGVLHRGPKLPAMDFDNMKHYYFEGGLYDICDGDGTFYSDPNKRGPRTFLEQRLEMEETRERMRELNVLHLYCFFF